MIPQDIHINIIMICFIIDNNNNLNGRLYFRNVHKQDNPQHME